MGAVLLRGSQGHASEHILFLIEFSIKLFASHFLF